MKLAASELSYGYTDRTIGRDLSFELAAGEVLCVLGPNGGGKTTLFRTLPGLLEPRGGKILIDELPLGAWPRRELAKVVGYVPQAHAGSFSFTVREMVLMGRTAHVGLFATPGPRDRDVTDRTIHDLGIAHIADRPYMRVSGGERQLTLIARALAQGSSILIMDEPTTSLDFGNQLLVLDQVVALARAGIGIIFSTHEPDHAFRCAGSVMLLRPGGLLRIGSPEEVVNPDNLHELYGVSVDVVRLSDGRRVCVPAPG